MSEYQISKETAQEQLQILLDHYDVDLSELDEDGRLKASVERKLIKAIRLGKVEIEYSQDELLVKQHVGEEVLTYHEITGMAKIRMGSFKENNERLYNLLAFLAKVKVEKIQRLRNQDLSVAEYLGMIFLMG